jgi:hypothetical protein
VSHPLAQAVAKVDLPAPVREDASTARPRTSRRRCTRRSAPTRSWPTSRTRWRELERAHLRSAAATTATASRPRPRTTGSGPATHRSQAGRRAPAHRRGHHVVLAAAALAHAGRDQDVQGRPRHPRPRGPAWRHGLPRSPRRRRPGGSTALAAELRDRSQQERKHVFWAMPLAPSIGREPSSCSAPRRSSPSASARPRATTCPASSTRSASACAATATSCAACSRPRAWPGRCSSRATTAAPATAPVDVGKAATEILGPRCCRGLRALRRGRRQGGRREEGHRRAVHRRQPERPAAGVRAARPAPRREGQAGVPGRERRLARGDRPDRGARQLRRHRQRPLPRRRARQGALRLGLRGGAPVRAVAGARRQGRGHREGPDLRRLDGDRSEGSARQQQPRSARARSGPRRASSSRSWCEPPRRSATPSGPRSAS